MSSVTKRISEIKQPRGGYVKPSQFEIHKINDGHILSETENIHASVVGMAVDLSLIHIYAVCTYASR